MACSDDIRPFEVAERGFVHATGLQPFLSVMN